MTKVFDMGHKEQLNIIQQLSDVLMDNGSTLVGSSLN